MIENAEPSSLKSMFPNFVEYSFEQIGETDHALFREEEVFVANAIASRKNEFYSGRSAARQALSRLGVPPASILVGEARSPVWPSGIIGSISHDGGWALAAVARKQEVRAYGLDITEASTLDRNLIDFVCSLDEVMAIEEMKISNFCPFKLLFSLKESVFKCLYPLVKTYFDFKDVEIFLEPKHSSASIHFRGSNLACVDPKELDCRYSYLESFIGSNVWIKEGR